MCCSHLPPCESAQAALSSLEQEAKENVYAVLDPHIQYEITINNHGEPPKYLSLSKPLTHQRTHAFDPHNINEINNNHSTENRFSTFKGNVNVRKSNRSNDKAEQRNVSKSNNDVEYIRNPNFGITRSVNNYDSFHSRDVRGSKNYTRMYERNNSGRSGKTANRDVVEMKIPNTDARRASNRSNKRNDCNDNSNRQMTTEANNSSHDAPKAKHENEEDYQPRPGKVREIASRFNQYSGNLRQSFKRKVRPKPLQSFGNQAYLDHVFPDAVEI